MLECAVCLSVRSMDDRKPGAVKPKLRRSQEAADLFAKRATVVCCLLTLAAGGCTQHVAARPDVPVIPVMDRSEEHTSELQSHVNLVCRLLLEKKKKKTKQNE